MISCIFVVRALLCAVVVALTFVGLLFGLQMQGVKELWAIWIALEWVYVAAVGTDTDPVSRYIIPGIATLFFFGKNLN